MIGPMRSWFPHVLLVLVLALAACGRKTLAPGVDPTATAQEQELQREMFVSKLDGQIVRLENLSSKIAASNLQFCRSQGKTLKTLGLFPIHYEAMPDGRKWATAYEKVLGASPDALTVLMVTSGGPAERAGLRRGDALLAVNEQKLDVGTRKNVLTSWSLPHREAQKGDVTIRFRRDGKEFEATVVPEEVCSSIFVVAWSNTVNAFADGRAVYVFQGMMDYAKTDDELALILGHEMAHNVMGHVDAMKLQRGFGAALDMLIALATGVNTGGMAMNAGGLAYSKEYEMEADYVGMYFAANAGADIETGPEIWRRMAADSPQAMSGGSTHPGSAERFTALAATRAEIEKKRAAGAALVPEMRN